MKPCISSLAWDNSENEEVAKILIKNEFTSLETTPGKIGNPLNINIDDCNKYKTFWKSKSISIIAMQSLLYGRPDLTIFDNLETRHKTLNYLRRIIDIATLIEAENIVFGSPKNRNIPIGMNKGEVTDISIDFFGTIAKYAGEKEVNFCLEPNSPDYECNFATNTEETVEICKLVNHPNFGINIDLGVLIMNKENIPVAINKANKYIKHFHISAPYLERVDSSACNPAFLHAVDALIRNKYSGSLSIEMKPNNEGHNKSQVIEAVHYVRSILKKNDT